MPGDYTLDLYLGSRERNFDVIHDAMHFEVDASRDYATGKLLPSIVGNVFWPVRWQITDERALEQ
jgi:hypothetical protein